MMSNRKEEKQQVDRNGYDEVLKDVMFLEEMGEKLENGDYEHVKTMIKDFKDDISPRLRKLWYETFTGAFNMERKRQIEWHGFDSSWDEQYVDAELWRAARIYACAEENRVYNGDRPNDWPWDLSWWKPSTDRNRELAKAGALYMAEIDRMEAAGEAKEGCHQELHNVLKTLQTRLVH